jgi:hypothetical protein
VDHGFASSFALLRRTLIGVASFLAVAGTAPGRDCNGNGVPDAEDIAAGSSEDCNRNGIPDECEGEPLPFGARSQLALPGTPRALDLADLDGDGRIDLAFAHGDSLGRGGVTVHWNRGAGSFEEESLAVGLTALALAAADLDGDGAPELAVADARTLRLIERRGGRLEEALALEMPERIFHLQAADLEGDGRAELLAAVPGADALVVFRRPGPSEGFAIPAELRAGLGPVRIALGDLDGDGDLDLVSANQVSRDLSLFLGDGAGGFAPERRQAVPGDEPQQVLAAALRSPGRSDLGVLGLKGVTVLRMAEDGQLAPASSFALEEGFTARGLGALAAADLDQDGQLDLVVGAASLRELAVLRGRGDGSFSAAVSLVLKGAPRAVRGADIDGDGDVDIATGLSTASAAIVWNDGGARSPDVSFSLRPIPLGVEPHGLTLADLDGDGSREVATGNGDSGLVTVVGSRGTPELRLLHSIVLQGHLAAIAAADLDGDGRPELAVVRHQGSAVLTMLRRSEGAGPEYRVSGNYAMGARPFFLAASDLNGDGREDLLSADEGDNAISIYFNDGEGSLRPRVSIPAGSGPIGAALGDFDGDGTLDVAVANQVSSSISLLFNDGRGAFPRRRELEATRPRAVAAADLDGDGWQDLAAAGNSRPVVELLRNRGGEFEPPVAVAVRYPSYSVSAGDLNGNGRPDLALAHPLEDGVSILLHEEGLSYREPLLLATGREPIIIAAADIDGDGSLDLATANHTGRQVGVFLNPTVAPFTGAYLERVCTPADFHKVSVPALEGGALRVTKYVAPAAPGDPELLPVLFQNARRYPLHQEFLAREFPERFPALDAAAYQRLVGLRASRSYFAGSIALLEGEGGRLYGFDVFIDSFSDPGELLRLEEARALHSTLAAGFTLRPLVYAPGSRAAREEAARWGDAGFPVHLGRRPAGAYRAYTPGVAYGRVRLLDREGFARANASGRIGFQDVLVLEEAPPDIEGVVAGLVTAEPQGELSHLAVRSARRGTPNAFSEDALERFAPLEGKLVRLEVRLEGLEAAEAAAEEAEGWWRANRPRLPEPPAPDELHAALDSFEEMDLSGAAGPPEARYGGKAAGMARLQRLLAGAHERYREAGFAVPARWYFDFLRRNHMPSFLDPERLVTYEECLAELLARPDFQSDSEVRFAALHAFRREAERNGRADPELVLALAARIEEVFGRADLMVRFRSSSTVEDLLEFNGAGLHDSTSACAADDLDLDGRGPSHCDPSQPDERGIERALKRVWASLWNFRAHEERAYYGLPPERAAMAVLVTRAFLDERANGVAFTANPADPRDRRYVVVAQAGEESVVSPAPGVRAEKSLLEIAGAEVRSITRAERSSLVEPGAFVLSDAELRELGALLAHVDRSFPIELGGRRRDEVLLDFEFKVEASGSLALKQVRPFLPGAPPPSPVFELVVAPGTEACGGFVEFREPREAYELKSRLRLAAGRFALPGAGEDFEAELFEEVLVGPARERASPAGPGVFRVSRSPAPGGLTAYRFRYGKPYLLAGGEPFELAFPELSFEARGAEPLGGPLLLEGERFIGEVALEGRAGRAIRYSSCTHESLPLWEVEVWAADGSRFLLEERFEPPRDLTFTGPAALTAAAVNARGAERRVADYWRLVYTAARHNLSVRYWVVLEPPLRLEGLERAVQVVDIALPEPRLKTAGSVSYLDLAYEAIATVELASAERREIAAEPMRFLRGDAGADGRVDLSDAILILDHLFRGGAAPPCEKAADADDSGTLSLTDALRILGHLFAGAGPLPEPSAGCGPDSTPDGLSCRRPPPCP